MFCFTHENACRYRTKLETFKFITIMMVCMECLKQWNEDTDFN